MGLMILLSISTSLGFAEIQGIFREDEIIEPLYPDDEISYGNKEDIGNFDRMIFLLT